LRLEELASLVDEVYQEVLKCVAGPKVKPRSGITEALKALASNCTVLLSAPPGYGKTMIPYCTGYLSCTASGPWPPRTIHVLPLRSIIEDCFRKLFEERGQPKVPLLIREAVARQSMDEAGSPWLQKRLIFTTLDTFMMCAMRLPPAEFRKITYRVSMGHGLLSKSAILASAIVFDEVHLFIEEGGKMTSALSALLWWLKAFSTPIIIMSATLPKDIESFVRRKLGNDVKILKYGVDFVDEDFEGQRRSIIEQLTTEKPRKGDVKEIAEEACKARESYGRVLVVLNTVRRCVRVAKMLEERGLRPIVLHGKIVSGQRMHRLEKLRNENWLAVSTQVVEAGVDISAQYLITDCAPPCALVQRVGRVLRWRRDIGMEGMISIFANREKLESNLYHGIYDADLVRTALSFLNVNHDKMAWHLPVMENRVGYERFIEDVWTTSKFTINMDRYVERKLKRLLYGMADVRCVLEWFEALGGSFVREEPLIIGFVNKQGLREGDSISQRTLEKLVEWQLPLSFSDLRKLPTSGFLTLSRAERGELVVRRGKRPHSVRKLVSMLLRGEILGILVPENLYHETYGLTFGGPSS